MGESELHADALAQHEVATVVIRLAHSVEQASELLESATELHRKVAELHAALTEPLLDLERLLERRGSQRDRLRRSIRRH
jgi:hypothetical protein